jgi:hypothetical protein
MNPAKFVSVGDLVWVQTGNQHEEPGTVLQVACERSLDVAENSDQDEDENEDDAKILNDGILVKLNVSLFRGTYAPQEVRAFHVEETAPKSTSTASSNGQRRSRRLVRTLVTPSPRSEVPVDNGKSSNQQSVDNDDDNGEEEEDKKPAAKRKRRESSMEAEPPTEPAKAKENSIKEDGFVDKQEAQASSPYFEKAVTKTAATTKAKAAAKKPAKASRLSDAEMHAESENESDTAADSTNGKAKGKTAATTKTKAAAKNATKQAKASRTSVAGATAEVPGGNENKNQSGIDANVVKAKIATATKAKAVAKNPTKKAKASKPSDAAEVPAVNENENHCDSSSDSDADPAKPKVKTVATKKTKAAAKKPVKKAKASKPSDSNSDGEADLTKPKVKTAASTKTKAAAKKPVKKAKASKPSVAAAVPAGNDIENQNDVDSDDENERPFIIEYSPTGRATCRRCDQTIARAALRVSHVPLFRGKPGFRIYRHLHCALFSEDIHQAQDVGGWKKLEQEDFEALTLRVQESKMEMEKENEEIRPDELVPLAFQGEIRKSPPGLTADLLPFQVEGASWMYCQEVNLPENRGGTLADEMGMVRANYGGKE